MHGKIHNTGLSFP